MRLEFILVIGIVLLMHIIYVAGTIAHSKEKTDVVETFFVFSLLLPLFTLATSIPTFIVGGLLYWWLY